MMKWTRWPRTNKKGLKTRTSCCWKQRVKWVVGRWGGMRLFVRCPTPTSMWTLCRRQEGQEDAQGVFEELLSQQVCRLCMQCCKHLEHLYCACRFVAPFHMRLCQPARHLGHLRPRRYIGHFVTLLGHTSELRLHILPRYAHMGWSMKRAKFSFDYAHLQLAKRIPRARLNHSKIFIILWKIYGKSVVF